MDNRATFIVDVDQDLLMCPIKLEIMRCPVLAKDGRHYELDAIVELAEKGKNRSPITQGPLFPVTLDIHLLSTIEKNEQTLKDQGHTRCPSYDTKKALEKLKALEAEFSQEFLIESACGSPWPCSILKSFGTAFSAGFMMLLINGAPAEELEGIFGGTLWILIAADLITRERSGHQFGLFDGTARMVKKLISQLNNTDAVEQPRRPGLHNV